MRLFSETTLVDKKSNWIEAIPRNWKSIKISRLARVGMGQTILREMLVDESSDQALPVYSASESDAPFGFYKNPAIILNAGDIIVGARGSIGKARLIERTSTCTQTTIWLKKFNSRIDSKFLYWCLVGGRESLFPFDKTAIPMLTVEQVSAGFIPQPSYEEQLIIAAFLDHETAKIDALIAEQEKLIALLAEKRQATISHAVTRGLNPDVPMKDSGVAWLGEVPSHWTILKLGYAAKLQGGYAFSAEDFGNEGIPVVRMNNLRRGRLDLSSAPRIQSILCKSSFNIKSGDLLWGMSGSIGETGSLGNFARVYEEDLPCQLNQRVGRFNCISSEILIDFLEWLIQSGSFSEQILLYVTGTAQFNISSEQVESCMVALPPIAEQIAIKNHLNNCEHRYDSLQKDAELAIGILKERRSALIASAVTGQIDVRGWTPKN